MRSQAGVACRELRLLLQRGLLLLSFLASGELPLEEGNVDMDERESNEFARWEDGDEDAGETSRASRRTDFSGIAIGSMSAE